MEQKDEKEEKPTPLFKTEKIDRVYISKEEFLRRLETIDEWRKQRLAELRAELRAKDSR